MEGLSTISTLLQSHHFPKFRWAVAKFDNYQYDIKQLRYQCGQNDYKFIAPKLNSQFQGALKDDFRNAQVDIETFHTDDGVDKLITYRKERLHITD